ncbi:carboxylesterase/lipase family protein [Hephaestia mangrovi]|uniref:carboxylesterase/lipase family protein n=1 Tax=Hephaestia mangrovi TaxID=2873268 RepID=UPI001CA68CA9|nr:carboxylesterase family protein [Hephaestia mangrovi]MBY8826511.1 carboxylesterase family protein [Hephaestia mangrovi]
MIKFHLLGLAAACCLAVGTAQAATGPVVDAPAGKLQGKTDGDLNVFKGIPFAKPPVGPLRWKPPEPLARWDGVKQATAFGPACIQPSPAGKSVYWDNPPPQSEDCLTLNIWAPAHAKNAPVFFWIYGGALWNGASSDPMYDGEKLAERGVIVVSINYRLGVLGWLATPQLSAESPDGISGNYGLLDQIQALEWVKQNIGAFGGDAGNVTIAGESAGALSVMYLMSSPMTHGLFAKAISESGYMVTVPDLKTPAHGMPSSERMGQAVMAAVKAPDMAAMRAMDPKTLTAAAAAAHYFPFGAVDGEVLPEQPVTAFDKGDQAHVPVLAGFNQGEIRSLMVLAPPPPASAADYEKTIRAKYGDLADEFLKLYPASDMKESIIETTRDALYSWSAERMVRKQTALGIPSYLYMWDHGYPAMDDAGLHAFHASELPFVFGTTGATPPLWPKIPPFPKERALSSAMMDYWTSFARSGTPTAENAPDWPAFDGDGAYMHFTDAPHPATDLLPGMYTLNEAVMCRRLAAGTQPWNWNVGLAAPPLPAKTEGCD